MINPDYFNVKVCYKNNNPDRSKMREITSSGWFSPASAKVLFYLRPILLIGLWPDAFFNWSNT